MKNIFNVNKDFVNTRLDKWFKKNISVVPQSLIEKSLRKGKIKVNNKKVKSSYRLQEKDQIFIAKINFTSNNFKNKKINTILQKEKLKNLLIYLLKIMKILL